MKQILKGIIIGFIFIFTCNSAFMQDKTEENINTTINANNQFAIEFYKEIVKNEKGNIFFSPYSISTAFSMAYEGARGKTAQEIQSIFHFLKDNKQRRLSNETIYNNFKKLCELNIANALWIRKGYKLSSNYAKVIEKYYNGNAASLDFKNAAEKSRTVINNWVKDKTDNIINNLMPQGFLNELTPIVIVNTVDFKGVWRWQFEAMNTKEENYKTGDNKTVKINMMNITNQFNYAKTKELQILEMMYKGNELSMLVFLPAKNDLISLEKIISPENFNEWKNKLAMTKVEIHIPKFKFENKRFLKSVLKDMSMSLVFSENANFSGINGVKGLFISDIIHSAYVDVNEHGTYAKAATSLMLYEGVEDPSKVPVFRADHPFIFIIQERKTGNILFLGRVVNPK